MSRFTLISLTGKLFINIISLLLYLKKLSLYLFWDPFEKAEKRILGRFAAWVSSFIALIGQISTFLSTLQIFTKYLKSNTLLLCTCIKLTKINNKLTKAKI